MFSPQHLGAWLTAQLGRILPQREHDTPEQLAYFDQDDIAGNAMDALLATADPADRAKALATLAAALRAMAGLIHHFPGSDPDDIRSIEIEARIAENTAHTQRAIAGLDAADLPLTTVLPGTQPSGAAAELLVWILLAGESDHNHRADYLELIADLVFDLAGGDAGRQAAELARCLANAERAAT